jgi:hypothetical protein
MIEVIPQASPGRCVDFTLGGIGRVGLLVDLGDEMQGCRG